MTTGIGQPIVTPVEMDALRPHKTLAVAAVLCLAACKQPLVVGEYRCPASAPEGGSPPSKNDPISIPWATGFEDQFCDYPDVTESGWCYDFPPSSYQIVASPVHSGQFAAAFTVLTGTDGGSGPQARCARQGIFPAEAYYGAWYYIPQLATNKDNWNLFHFQGGSVGGSSQHFLWDVSLVNAPTGELDLRVYDDLQSKNGTSAIPIPIGKWFHLVFYWKRAKDTTGEVALYQDGTQVVDFTNLITDDTDWDQWYVGNLATALQPPQSTVYVDDVTIRATP